MPREKQEDDHEYKIVYEDGVVLFTPDSERIHWRKVESENLVINFDSSFSNNNIISYYNLYNKLS